MCVVLRFVGSIWARPAIRVPECGGRSVKDRRLIVGCVFEISG